MRHHDVCHYYVGAQVEETAQPFHAVVGGVDDEVLALQCLFDNHGEGSFVLNQQYVDFLHFFIVFSDKKCRVLQRIMRYFETSHVLFQNEPRFTSKQVVFCFKTSRVLFQYEPCSLSQYVMPFPTAILVIQIRIVNVLPFPGSLFTLTLPLCFSVMVFT